MIHIFFWITILGFLNSPAVLARGGGTSSPGLAMFSLIIIGFLAIAFYYEDRYLKITGRKFGPFTLSIILAVIGSLIISFLLLMPFGIKFADSGLFLGLMIIFISYWFIIKYLMSPIYKDNNGKLITDCGSTPVLADTSKYDTNQLNKNSDLLCDNSHQQQLSSSVTTLSSDIESGPRGVGGWLLFLIISMIILGPLIGAARTNFDFMTTESQYSGLASIEEWVSYKNFTWLVFFSISAMSVYGGVTLSRSNDWSAVDRAIAILWLAGPVGAFIQNIVAYTILDDYVFFNFEFIKQIIYSLLSPIIWTSYLKNSKRVRNTYKDALDVTVLWEKRNHQQKYGMVQLLFGIILSLSVVSFLSSVSDKNNSQDLTTLSKENADQQVNRDLYLNNTVQPTLHSEKSQRSYKSSDLPVVKLTPNAQQTVLKKDFQIEEAQHILRGMGYYKGAVDGIYGPQTRSAIVNFQKNQGLKPDGMVSDNLIAHLNDNLQSFSNIEKSANSEGNSNTAVIAKFTQGENKYPGKPSMARATASEQASIENVCAPARRDVGRDAYYHCINQQMNALGYQ